MLGILNFGHRFQYPRTFVIRVAWAFPREKWLHAQLKSNGVFAVENFLRRSKRQDL